VTDRHRAREAALQALYFWEVGGASPDVALETVFADHQPDATPAARAFAGRLVGGVSADLAALDARIAAHSTHWRVERLAAVDRLILRLAAWELEHEPDTPAPVILDEAVELARTFGGDESARFVNGVLDALAKGLGR
jgi:N utilization substance protein B